MAIGDEIPESVKAVQETPKKKPRGRKSKEIKVIVKCNLTEDEIFDRLMTMPFFQNLVNDIWNYVSKNYPTASSEETSKMVVMIWQDWWSKQK